ncbi:histidine phosphatase family protein [Aliikangiella coralliicola]|uniref:Histidine phosphatase family protein n=1 Tax=Aliikangiella coralliicola TaxID=2592383 RepID=A0A545UJH9_9GAMM|nr:histidine phosphatase family protein [Aliikangiella coralliicola]TQV89625.1 histidine phosphatase family protein [Aliikangiella coralliicola]
MEKQKTCFYLARHGETQWNKIRRLQGRLDSSLTVAGKNQATQIVESLSRAEIELIVSSPLGRAKSTAELCRSKISVELKIHDLLVERHFGDWQSSYFDDLSDKEHFEQVFFQVTEHAPPRGESGLECGSRIQQALSDIAQSHSESKILVVTHGDAIRCFMATLAQDSHCDAYSQYGNGKIFPINYCHQFERFTSVGS